MVLAAMNGGAAGARCDAGLTQHGHGLLLAECGLQRAQLRIDLAERAQLGDHQGVVALSEAVQVEDKPAEVAIGELARLAQKARAAAHAPARPEAGLRGQLDGADRRALVHRLALARRLSCRWGSRGRSLIHSRSMLPRSLKRRAPYPGHALGHGVSREAHRARAAGHAIARAVAGRAHVGLQRREPARELKRRA